MFKRVLIPLDGSKASSEIINQIDVILPPGVGEVLLLHVGPAVACAYTRSAAVIEEKVRRKEADLERMASELCARGYTARALVRRGEAHEQIIHVAIEEGADLIAMTKRGFSAITRLLVGSVADRVVRHSPVPVLLLRAESLWQRGTHAVPPEKILVPLDGSDRALRILPHVVKLARGFGSRVGLLYVARSAYPSAVMYEDLDRPSAERVSRQMEKAARKLRKKGLRVSIMVLTGDPAEQIIRIERAQGYDLVAMCTHGRRGLERWLMGSVTEKVLRAADVPLMVLRNVYMKPGIYGARRRAATVR